MDLYHDSFVNRAYRVFVINSILSSLGVTIGTTVDSIIVGNALGELGLASLSVALPIYMFYNMISFALGMGGSTQVSIAIGNDDRRGAKEAFTFSLALGLAIGVVVSVLGTIFIDPLVSLLGGGGLPADYQAYMRIAVVAAPIFIVVPILNLMLRSDANPKLATIGIAVSAVVNLVLDIVFIFFMDMGILGAALAMVLGQMGAMVAYCFHFVRRRIALGFTHFKFSLRQAAAIFTGGFGVASNYIYQCVYILVFNNILAFISGNSGVAVFNAVFNASMFAYAVFDGISLSLPPLVGTFFGERNNAGIKQTMRLASMTSLVAGLFITLLLLLFAPQVVSIFGIGHLADVGGQTLRLYSIGVVFTCFNSLLACYYQTIGENRLAMLINLLRGLVLILGLGIPFILTLGVTGIGHAFLWAEVITFAVAMLAAVIKKKRKGFDSIYLLNEYNITEVQIYETSLDKDFKRLPEIVEEIEAFCERNGISAETTYNINLTIEELASNIIQFGFTDKKPHYISIKVAVYDEDVYVRMRDDATHYNPFDHARGDDAGPDDLPDEAQLDLLGVTMIRAIAKSFDYQRKLVFNNLLIIL